MYTMNYVTMCLFLLGLSCYAQTAAIKGKVRPNIILINADDLGYGDLGCYGATKISTPNIDGIAKEGRKFTDAHSASAVCTPSRYALITGEYPFRAEEGKGIWGPLKRSNKLIIDPREMTIGDVLQGEGYETACIGKWHLGFGTETPTDWNKRLVPGPLQLGFDYYFGVPYVNSGPPYVYVENDKVVGLKRNDPMIMGGTPISKTQLHPDKNVNTFSGGTIAHVLYKDDEIGTTLAGKSVDWIRKKRDKPFFLYLATTNIHHPFTPAAQFIGTSEAGLYGDFVHELDWIVGQVVAAVDEMGLTENTLIIVTSDNGGMLNIEGQNAWKKGHRLNGELLGFKFDAWEGGHRVPFVAKWPGKITPGTVSDALISNVDFLATFADILEVDLKSEDIKDSSSFLSSLVEGEKKQQRDELVLSPWSKKNLALRKGKWLYIGAQGGGGFTGENIGDHSLGGPAAHLLTQQVNSDIDKGKLKQDAGPIQLYNLAEDLSQTNNLYKEYPEIATELQVKLNEYQKVKY